MAQWRRQQAIFAPEALQGWRLAGVAQLAQWDMCKKGALLYRIDGGLAQWHSCAKELNHFDL